MFKGRGGAQKYAEIPSYTRQFLVIVDDIHAFESDIVQSCGIAMLSAHPDIPAALCVNISVAQDGDSPYHFKVTHTYGVMDDADEDPLQRPDQFTYSGAITSGPAFIHYNEGNGSPQVIVNTAFDPLEGMEMEKGEWRISITGNRATFDKGMAGAYLNAVNSDEYSGMAAGTVKCQGISGVKRVELVNELKVAYYEVTVELAYREETWRLQTWDVGFNEIVGGKREKILDEKKKPVSQPVALSGGVKKAVGQPPDMLTFKIYKELSFAGIFPVLP